MKVRLCDKSVFKDTVKFRHGLKSAFRVAVEFRHGFKSAFIVAVEFRRGLKSAFRVAMEFRHGLKSAFRVAVELGDGMARGAKPQNTRILGLLSRLLVNPLGMPECTQNEVPEPPEDVHTR